MFLYLDDIRIISPDIAAITVRNYDEFVAFITKQGIPYIISFDHDLGEDIAKYKYENGILSKRKARKEKKDVKSGYDCALWLVNYCRKKEIFLQNVYVHSQNPGGAKRIVDLINDFMEECGQKPTCRIKFWPTIAD